MKRAEVFYRCRWCEPEVIGTGKAIYMTAGKAQGCRRMGHPVRVAKKYEPKVKSETAEVWMVNPTAWDRRKANRRLDIHLHSKVECNIEPKCQPVRVTKVSR